MRKIIGINNSSGFLEELPTVNPRITGTHKDIAVHRKL